MQPLDRAQPRLRSIIGARIIFNNGASSLDCLIRDISGSGARLELSSTVTIPDHFDIVIPQKNQTHRCVIKWRRGNEVGVEFEVEHREGGEVLERLSRLEAEVAGLKRAIAATRRVSD